MTNLYLTFKALHIIFMVAWFAGLFYIFRLFVYHAKFKAEPKMAEAYTLMERKLLHIIMHPAMTLTFIFGLGMVYLNPSFLKAGWFHFKLLGVAVLLGYQIFSGVVHKRFARGDFFLSEKSCRIINEVPTLCLVLIVFWVVFK